MGDLLGDRRRDLEAAGPRPHQGDPFAGQVDVVVPAGRMKRRPAERVPARQVRQLGSVELPDRGDDRVRGQRPGPAVGGAHRQRPVCSVVVPDRRDDLGVPLDVWLQLVTAHHVAEIGRELGLLGEEVLPVVAGFEAVAVEVIGHVDASTGIAVLPPCSARAAVLLQDHERDPGLAETDPREQAGFAAPDDGDAEILRVGGVQRRGPARVGGVEVELFENERQVVLVHRFCGRPVQHLFDQRSRQRFRDRAAAVAILHYRRQGGRASPGLVLLAHEALDLVEEQAGLREVADEARVTGQMHHRQQQGGNADLLQCRGDFARRGGEGACGVKRPRHGRPLNISLRKVA